MHSAHTEDAPGQGTTVAGFARGGRSWEEHFFALGEVGQGREGVQGVRNGGVRDHHTRNCRVGHTSRLLHTQRTASETRHTQLGQTTRKTPGCPVRSRGLRYQADTLTLTVAPGPQGHAAQRPLQRLALRCACVGGAVCVAAQRDKGLCGGSLILSLVTEGIVPCGERVAVKHTPPTHNIRCLSVTSPVSHG